MAAAAKKVFDVAKPGDSAPDATAKPVIVGHKPEVEDPTLTKATATAGAPITVTDAKKPAASDDAETIPVQSLSPSGRKVIQPISHDNEAAVENASPEDTSRPEGEQPEDAENRGQTEEASEDNSESAVMDAVIEKAGGSKKAEDTVAAAKKEALEKLAESKQYYLPIRESASVRSFERVMIGILLALLAGLVAFDLAIDSGLIKSDIKPIIDLIKN